MKRFTKDKHKLNLLLVKAVVEDKISTARVLIKRGADPLYRGEHDKTLLHMVRSERMVRLLYNAGVDINAKDRGGKTAMQYAITYDFLDESVDNYPQYNIVREFLKLKPDIEAIDRSGKPLLHSVIVANLFPPIILDVINAGADVNAKTADGNTALHAVVGKLFYDLDIVTILLTHGANIYIPNNDGITPLYLASSGYPCAETIKLFMTFGNEIDLTFLKGYNVFHWIMLKCFIRPSSMKKILEYNFYRNLINDQSNEARCTLLHLVCSDTKGNIKLAKLVIKAGANINAKDRRLRTPLHVAICNPNCDHRLVELLINSGARVNLQDYKGFTPLHCALSKEKVKYGIIKTLLNHGADLSIESIDGTTPFFSALKNPLLSEKVFQELVKLLYENDFDKYLYGSIHQNPISLCIRQGKLNQSRILFTYMILKSFATYKVFELLIQFLFYELPEMSRDIRDNFVYIFLESWGEIKQMKFECINGKTVSLLEVISLDIFTVISNRGEASKQRVMNNIISRLSSTNYSIYNNLLMTLRKDNLIHTLEDVPIFCRSSAMSDKVFLDQCSVYHLIKLLSKQDLINLLLAYTNDGDTMYNIMLNEACSSIMYRRCKLVFPWNFRKESDEFVRLVLELHYAKKLDE